MNKIWMATPVLLCLNITSVSAAFYDFNSGLNGFQTFGGTTSIPGAVRLTPSTGGTGSLFLNNTANATKFNASFDFFIGNGTGADGLTFAWVETAGLGIGGGGLGFNGLQGYSVEFDSYNNNYDSSENHIGINHNNVSSLKTATAPEFEDTGWHHVDVVFDSGQIQVSMDSIQYIDYLISGYSGFDAYFGFTASTGGLTNEHLIDNFSLTISAVPIPASVWLFGSALMGLVGVRKKASKLSAL